MRRLFVVTLLAAMTACSSPKRDEQASVPASSAPVTFARAADAGPMLDDGGLQAPSIPDRAALEELLAKVPKEISETTGPDGGTRIGTEVQPEELEAKKGAAEEAKDEKDAGPPRAPKVGDVQIAFGDMVYQSELSNPAIERALRAQIYFSLVKKCRDKDGNILPPDAIKMHFNIDADGHIVPSTITAAAEDPRYEDAANCMRRELSSATFRAPKALKGQPTAVDATVPSTD